MMLGENTQGIGTILVAYDTLSSIVGLLVVVLINTYTLT